MGKLPDYVGPCAFGIKMGVVTPNCDLLGMVSAAVQQCDRDEFLDDGDVICLTESVVARAQNNFVSTDEIAAELQEKHNVKADSRLGVLFPITSRNRFALILKGFAKAVPRGEVVVQFSFPCDEVGNMIVLQEFADSCELDEIFTYEKIKNHCLHPITNIDYPGYYQKIIEGEGARAKIFLSNNPEAITSFYPDCLIISSIHDRAHKYQLLKDKVPHCITLQDISSDPAKASWSEWGLLGSNMSSDNLLNLAPRDGDAYAMAIQKTINDDIGKDVEVILYGDGAYKDPVSGIYELADPQPSLGSTIAFKDGRMREGVKYKMLADTAYAAGKSPAEIEEILAATKKAGHGQHEIASEGTTPRKLEDLIASLADLVSGSADAGTPLILVKGLFKER
jgi:F420-0:gamma-glutamyl ligase